jgi:fatty-acyl-CoA synthase
MAALLLRPGTEFDPEAFSLFLSDQTDLGTKAAPKFVRVASDLPLTATSKVLKRVLRHEAWRCTDTVWWRPERDPFYRMLSSTEADDLDQAVATR